MKNIKGNKKGFTLVELLAVIVVLAILVLLAMPAVLNMMQRAQRSAFVTEANNIARIGEMAYSDQILQGNLERCFSLERLNTLGYMNKAIATNMYGSVQINTPSAGPATVQVWFSNGAFYFEGLERSSLTEAGITNGAPANPTRFDRCGSTS